MYEVYDACDRWSIKIFFYVVKLTFVPINFVKNLALLCSYDIHKHKYLKHILSIFFCF